MPLRFINPNFHVILIHYPLGVFVLGVFLELFSFLWRNSSVRGAARWMIVLGALLSVPAVTSGIYALYTIAKYQGIEGERYSMLRWHAIWQSAASILAVTCAVAGLGASDRWRDKLRLPLLAGVVLAWAGMVVGSWYGGETIYQNGTSVLIINKEGEAQKIKQQTYKTNYAKIVNFYMGGTQQSHITMSGFALAVAFGALGLSIRKLTTSRAAAYESEADVIAEREVAMSGGVAVIHHDAPPRRAGSDDMTVLRSFNPDVALDEQSARTPAARWWLLAALAFVSVAVGGYWIMSGAHFADSKGWNDFTGTLEGETKYQINRHLAHLVLGGAMALLALLMAVLARWGSRNGVMLTLTSALLVLVIAAQIWIGVLLTFDSGHEGPLTKFNPPDESAAATPMMVDGAVASAAPGR